MARKRKSKPTSKKRTERQKTKDRYAHARDDAQRLGLIETLPEEALVDERVNPATQGFQPLTGLIGQGVRKGYATPEHMKIRQVDELHAIATSDEVEPHVRVGAIRTAVMADQQQWERDNPELAGKSKGGVHIQNSNTQTNVDVWAQMLKGGPRPDPVKEALEELANTASVEELQNAPDATRGAVDGKPEGESYEG